MFSHHNIQALGLMTHFEKIEVEYQVTRPIWPKAWVEQQGSGLVVRDSAPLSAVVFPVAISGATDTFVLRSNQQRTSDLPSETIEIDLTNVAYINRWQRTLHTVGSDLWIEGTSVTAAQQIDVWFYFVPNPNHPALRALKARIERQGGCR